MYANLRFDFPAPSTGGWEMPWRWFGGGSQGATSAGQLVEQAHPISTGHTAPSIGGLVVDYGRQLVATASSHTILDSIIVPVVVVDEIETVASLDDPLIRPIFEEVTEMATLTGLPKARIAEDLVGVSRRAYYDWLEGRRVSLENERRIRGTLDVLRRASARYATPELLRGWLVTPVGSRALAPIDLLKAGKIDEARLLLVSSLPKRDTALPAWLLTASINDWSEREHKRRSAVLREFDAISRDALEE